VTIEDNVVEGNDLGNPTGAPVSGSKYKECNATPSKPPAPAVPGDCGEGIHLMVATNSVVEGNTVVDNSGGILLSDEFGPTSHNVISHNTVAYNALDCGVTVVSHSPKGFAGGKVQPAAGGVYDNVVSYNVITTNGLAGQGGGVILATPLPGGAVYGNQVLHNTIRGNGMAGVVLHSHAPGQDLNGNVVEHNTIGTNNLEGDPDFAPHVDFAPTGVLVASAASPVRVTVADNTISRDAYGVWQTGPVVVSGLPSNHFTGGTLHGMG
jgi:parallel beta-helix repeat protein